MTDLSANKVRTYVGAPGRQIEWPMGANSQLYLGAALMMNASTGRAANVTPTASGVFIGFARGDKDNRTGSPYGGTDGSTTITTLQNGRVLLTVARASSTFVLTDVGTTVYASDGDTFTTSAGTNNIPIGKIAFVPDAAVGNASAQLEVDFEATSQRSL
jgi:hypothetical protein